MANSATTIRIPSLAIHILVPTRDVSGRSMWVETGNPSFFLFSFLFLFFLFFLFFLLFSFLFLLLFSFLFCVLFSFIFINENTKKKREKESSENGKKGQMKNLLRRHLNALIFCYTMHPAARLIDKHIQQSSPRTRGRIVSAT
jgi:Ca2+/Na+ antiporter